ncbi:MAG: hypothetical protein Aurels2KO_38660 [Aureliella sp.]
MKSYIDWLMSLRARQLATFLALFIPLAVTTIYAVASLTSWIGLAHQVRNDDVPSVILYLQALEKSRELNSNLLDYLAGEVDEYEEFNDNTEELRNHFDDLREIESLPFEQERLAKAVDLFETYARRAKSDVFEPYSPEREHSAIKAADDLQNTIGIEIREALVAYSDKEYQDALQETDLSDVIQDDLPGVFKYLHLADAASTMVNAVSEYVAGEMEEQLIFATASRRFDRVLSSLEEIETRESEKIDIADLKVLHNQISDEANRIFTGYNPGNKRRALKAADQLEHVTLEKLTAILALSATEEKADAIGQIDTLNSALILLRLTILTMAVAGSVLGVSFFLYTANGIARSFEQSVDAANSIAEGNLDKSLPKTGPTEARQLSESLSEMVKRLKQQREVAEARERADAANLAKSRFLASMSHEIRTPLNAILGMAQLLRRARNLDERGSRQVEAILSSGEHLLTLINDVLELSKIEAGKIELNEKPFAISSLCDQLRAIFDETASSAGIEFDIKIDRNVPETIMSDHAKVRQTLVNLLGNAFKFVERGHVHLSVGCQVGDNKNRTLCFDVDDTGPGIPLEDRQLIFRAFEQSTAACSTQDGTGLGLSLCRKFADILGGKIFIVDKAGPGVCFRLELPLKLSDAQMQIERSSMDAEHGYSLSLPEDKAVPTVLIVDDVHLNREVIFQMFEEEPLDLVYACDGVEAVTQCKIKMPELILMDIRMPRMDGWTAIKKIRDLPGGSHPKIITVTASVFDIERGSTDDSGADCFIRKPVTEAELFDTTARLLGLELVEGTPQASQEGQGLAEQLGELPIMELRQATSKLSRKELLNILNGLEGEGKDVGDLIAMANRFAFQELESRLSAAEVSSKR